MKNPVSAFGTLTLRERFTPQDIPVDGRIPIHGFLFIEKGDEGRPLGVGDTGRGTVEQPRGGELRAKLEGNKTVPLPLKHTDVKAQISLYIGAVTVEQQYHNPYSEKIEAVYVFPLPQNAAVSDFIMVIGDRYIRGIIREREEARKMYEEARRQGYTASLLSQDRPNIFTQSIANIEPGKEIDVNITYFHTLKHSKGTYEFVFPMVVGPRFNPQGSTDGVGAVGRGSRGASGQKTEVEYLRPDEISSHDISLSVDIDAGVTIEKIESPSHEIDIERPGEAQAKVTLSPNDRIPNKDFVLRYKVAGRRLKAALLTHRKGEDGYFTLMLQPPETLEGIPAPPREMVFVLDCSGSMSGEPIAAAKRALKNCLRRLRPGDTFQVIRFSNDASALGPAPIAASPDNIRRGLRYVESLNSEGGTMMIEGIKAALDFPHDPGRFRIVSFMTDGYIGNDRDIIGEVKKRVGAARIFSFGVGSSPNRYLLERMAHLGRGVVGYFGNGESSKKAADELYLRIEHPALCDIQIDWGGMQVAELHPNPLPDLFVGRPVILTGRFRGKGTAQIRVSGRIGTEAYATTLTVDLDDSGARHASLANIWARAKIADLYDRMTWHPHLGELTEEIKHTALHYGLVSAFTSFIAVDSSRRTEGDHGTTVKVPVPVPDGVRYETTVEDK
ncbi:MAG: VIT domain-containing protein [Planctomycetota bacterium]